MNFPDGLTQLNPSLSLPVVSMMIITSSFFGSWHCAGMCSPLATLAANQGQLWKYQMGRVISYTLLGGIAGFAGQFFLKSEFKLIQTLSILILSSSLIIMGFFSFKNYDLYSKIKFNKVFKMVYFFQKKFKLTSGFLIGFSSGLLPCGWLYTFLISSMASKSPLAGALFMFLFAVGGIPALSAVSVMVQKNILKANDKKKKIAGSILIIAGVYALFSHLFVSNFSHY